MNVPFIFSKSKGFSLVELLIAMSITVMVILLMVNMLQSTQNTWNQSHAQVESYRSARAAFEALSRNLSQATLNSYWDYNDPNLPTYYQRQSELHYLNGPAHLLNNDTDSTGHAIYFQAPLGIDHLSGTEVNAGLDHCLNGWGYYTRYAAATDLAPDFVDDLSMDKDRKRFRLMEFRLPSEEFNVFQMPVNSDAGAKTLLQSATDVTTLYGWFRAKLATRSYVLADNVLGLIVLPEHPGELKNTRYDYDTREFQLTSSEQAKQRQHQLPASLRVTLIALDEKSWMARNPQDAEAETLIELMQSSFKNPANYEQDLAEVEAALQNLKLGYRVFSTSIAIRSAKWITEQDQIKLSP